MSKTLNFKQLTPGFSLRRASCEFGDFRIWIEDGSWFWALNPDSNSYGSEDTLEEAIAACQKYYEFLLLKKIAPVA